MVRKQRRKTSFDAEIGRWIIYGESVGNVLFRLAEMSFVIGVFILAARLTDSSFMNLVATILLGAMTLFLFAICWKIIRFALPTPRYEGYAILWFILTSIVALAIAIGLAFTIRNVVSSEALKIAAQEIPLPRRA